MAWLIDIGILLLLLLPFILGWKMVKWWNSRRESIRDFVWEKWCGDKDDR